MEEFDYWALCHSNKANDITHMIVADLKSKIDRGFGTKADLKAMNIFNHDLVAIIAYGGYWWCETYSCYTYVPNYFMKWAERFLLKAYNIKFSNMENYGGRIRKIEKEVK